jgi:hypothetical protein
MNILGEREQASFAGYDPRSRPWFEQAKASADQIKTRPYIFFTSQELGQTIALRALGSGATVGADISLDTLAASLRKERITEHTELALFGSDLGMICTSRQEEGRGSFATIGDRRGAWSRPPLDRSSGWNGLTAGGQSSR